MTGTGDKAKGDQIDWFDWTKCPIEMATFWKEYELWQRLKNVEIKRLAGAVMSMDTKKALLLSMPISHGELMYYLPQSRMYLALQQIRRYERNDDYDIESAQHNYDYSFISSEENLNDQASGFGRRMDELIEVNPRLSTTGQLSDGLIIQKWLPLPPLTTDENTLFITTMERMKLQAVLKPRNTNPYDASHYAIYKLDGVEGHNRHPALLSTWLAISFIARCIDRFDKKNDDAVNVFAGVRFNTFGPTIGVFNVATDFKALNQFGACGIITEVRPRPDRLELQEIYTKVEPVVVTEFIEGVGYGPEFNQFDNGLLVFSLLKEPKSKVNLARNRGMYDSSILIQQVLREEIANRSNRRVSIDVIGGGRTDRFLKPYDVRFRSIDLVYERRFLAPYRILSNWATLPTRNESAILPFSVEAIAETSNIPLLTLMTNIDQAYTYRLYTILPLSEAKRLNLPTSTERFTLPHTDQTFRTRDLNANTEPIIKDFREILNLAYVHKYWINWSLIQGLSLNGFHTRLLSNFLNPRE